MPGRNHASHSYKPGRPIIDENNYADAPVYAINPVLPRASSHRGHEQQHQNGNGNPRPHAGRKASEAVNLNHLLNFSMPRREGRDVPGSGHVPRRSRGVRNAAYNKERYVNAQFRFVMKPTANYAAHFADPDLFYQWPQILQVIVPTVSALSVAQGDEPSSSGINAADRKEKEREGMTCPICLGQPVAPRMTKCGHIFCYPCILHYFQLSDIPKTAKCPICGDTIQERMLKSVRWADNEVTMPEHGDHYHHHHEHDPVVGELEFDTASRAASNSSAHKLKMRLVQRPQITTLALPRSATWPSEAVPLTQAPWHFIPDVMSFSKFMLATSEYMLAELTHNLRELEQERVLLDGDDLGKSFVESAMRHVRHQMEKAKMEMDTPALRKAEREVREACVELESVQRAKIVDEREKRLRAERKEVEVLVSGEGVQDGAQTAELVVAPVENHDSVTSVQQQATPGKSKNRRAVARAAYIPHDEPSYLYYQAASGANVYLHPLDIKILLAHHKSYTAFPDTITVRPEGADEGTINEELRRRCKYLAHLQMGTDVVFVEADLEDTLGPEAVAQFEQALKQRRNRRRERIKKDDKAKLKWEAQEREKMPFGVRTAPSHSGDADEDFLFALQRSTVEMGPPGTAGAGSALGESEASSSPTTYDLGTSFPASSGNTRISPSGAGMSVSPPAWAAAAHHNNHNKSFASALHAPPGTRTYAPKRNPETDWEIERAWSAFEESASLARAAASSTPVDGGATASEVASAGGGGGKGGKKAKPKKLVLSMSSGGRRA